MKCNPQRRTFIVRSMGVGNRNAPALINGKTGEREPGYVPSSMVRADGFNPVDSWAKQDRGVSGKINYVKPNPFDLRDEFSGDRARAIHQAIIPYSTLEQAPYAGWDMRMAVDEHIPTGLEWKDPDQATIDKYERMIVPTPEGAFLHPHICAALRGMGIETLTRPQYEAIYALNINQDLMLGSHPGSGKTSAVVWHVLNKMLKHYPNAPFSTLWLVPHENLARQTLRLFSTLGKLCGIPDDNTFCLCIDSKPIDRNYDELAQHRPAVLIGTPNRIGDMIHVEGSILEDMEVNTLQRIIVDEVDEVLPAGQDEGLGASLMYSLVVHRRNKRKHIKFSNFPQQKIFISSTLTNQGKDYLRTWYRNRQGKTIETHKGLVFGPRQGDRTGMNPKQDTNFFVERRNLEEDGTTKQKKSWSAMSLQQDIDHVSISTSRATRWATLADVVEKFSKRQNKTNTTFFRGLIIVADGTSAKSAAAELYKKGFEGKVGRLENPAALESYANGTLPILISTPKFIRGMNLPYLTHVFICVGVKSPAEYVRMSGRVGRGGLSGVTVNVITPEEYRGLRDAGKRLGITINERTERDLNGLVMLPVAEAVVETREHSIRNIIPGGTAVMADPSWIKALLVDDPDAVDTLKEGDPHSLTTLDMTRNKILPTGQVKPDIDQKQWIAGTSPSVLHNEGELNEIELTNTYTYMVKPEKDLATPSTQPDAERPLPGGSINPDIASRYSNLKSGNPYYSTKHKGTEELENPMREGNRLLRQHDHMQRGV